jgi:hypothetical protein
VSYPPAERELIVVAQLEIRLRATADGVSSEAGAEIEPLTAFLQREGYRAGATVRHERGPARAPGGAALGPHAAVSARPRPCTTGFALPMSASTILRQSSRNSRLLFYEASISSLAGVSRPGLVVDPCRRLSPEQRSKRKPGRRSS